MKILVIIPTLNERDNLIKLIPAIFNHLPGAEVLITDDHSEDGTKELQAPHVHILDRRADHGYGKAVLDGFRFALAHGFENVITIDADFSHDARELPAMFAKLDQCDVVVGSRYARGGGIANWSRHRRLLSWFANQYVRFILRTALHDNTTGFMGYRRSVVERLLAHPPGAEGYAFLVEVKYRIKDFRIIEHPIIYTERREGKSKMSWKNIWESVWLPWRLKFGKLK